MGEGTKWDQSNQPSGHADQSGKRDDGSDESDPELPVLGDVQGERLGDTFFVPPSSFNAASNRSLAASIFEVEPFILLAKRGIDEQGPSRKPKLIILKNAAADPWAFGIAHARWPVLT
ncbi:hypothetical protein [Bradyrhizobium sp. WSM471]|uniref:hypothetical protein n=1 Tax=Bradyrhizobium sp. WSM471 TaxID=319017 RepID=UPI0012F767C8|nr:MULTISPECIES: hypothetical protein [Bradyrhizobium]UFW42863.1 hypothetical protein BcanWSM471_06705 [Bradyrhizobium canariense]